jgi:hypothetical protein
MITFLRAHKHVISRVITFSLVAFCAFWLTPSWSEVGPFGFLFFFALFVMLIVSQIFWVGRVVDLGERFIPESRAAPGLRPLRVLSVCSSSLTTSASTSAPGKSRRAIRPT